MKQIRSLLSDAALLSSPRYSDARGSFTVAYEVASAEAVGLPSRFVQDNHSVSERPGTIRGLHLQLPPHSQGKLVRVLRGRILDVIVDVRPGSPTHGQHAAVELDVDQGHQLWVPRGFAHGFCTLEPNTEVFYKVDAPYDPVSERTLAWDDRHLNIDWPVDHGDVHLSEKDSAGWTFAAVTAAIEEVSS